MLRVASAEKKPRAVRKPRAEKPIEPAVEGPCPEGPGQASGRRLPTPSPTRPTTPRSSASTNSARNDRPPRPGDAADDTHGSVYRRARLVTGSASNIGRAIALALAREGARVRCVDVDAARNAAVVDGDHQGRRHGRGRDGRPVAPRTAGARRCRPPTRPITCSCTRPRRRGARPTRALAVSEATWDAMHEHQPALGLLPRPRARAGACGGAASRGACCSSPRCTPRRRATCRTTPPSKAGQTMVVKELARALGPAGIRVNALAPGAVPGGGFNAAAFDFSGKIPLGRLGQRRGHGRHGAGPAFGPLLGLRHRHHGGRRRRHRALQLDPAAEPGSGATGVAQVRLHRYNAPQSGDPPAFRMGPLFHWRSSAMAQVSEIKASARPRSGNGRRPRRAPRGPRARASSTAMRSEPETIAVDYNELAKLIGRGKFLSTVFDLDIDGKKQPGDPARGAARPGEGPARARRLPARRRRRPHPRQRAGAVHQRGAVARPEARRRAQRRAPRGRGDLPGRRHPRSSSSSTSRASRSAARSTSRRSRCPRACARPSATATSRSRPSPATASRRRPTPAPRPRSPKVPHRAEGAARGCRGARLPTPRPAGKEAGARRRPARRPPSPAAEAGSQASRARSSVRLGSEPR